ncbi:hypothetical protein VP496E541_P0188 [Vibrio phage 496E54-1]|nr:hypothetical protein VP495E541_P0188 [Vibrio phage 495E54-1]CAH9014348.1 hypothetical protein VP496E541_P0188 [Vibrio phage 496E54-1]
MKIKEEVIIEEAYHSEHDLYEIILALIRQEFDVSYMEKMKGVDEKVKKEYNRVGQYFFDQGRKYEQEKINARKL